jgi:hypothetical protein
MGWRGVIRSLAAAQRASERESLRRHRQYVRDAKQNAKLEALRQAAFEVEDYQNHIERLVSVHQDCGATWNWKQIADAPRPAEPARSNGNEAVAARMLEEYRPGFFDRLFRLAPGKQSKLKKALDQARLVDKAANEAALAAYQARLNDWREMGELASRIVRLDTDAMLSAFDELCPLRELSDLGSRVAVRFREGDAVASAVFTVNDEAVIPREEKTLLQSGKLSRKKMPEGRFNELYQDYVASAAIRIARELLALLPLRAVLVTALGHMLDTSSGHMADQPVLSAIIPRATLDSLNFQKIDPSDAMRNFIHRMDFKKSRGFGAIVPLELSDVPPQS